MRNWHAACVTWQGKQNEENADNFIKKYKESVSKTVAEQLKGVAPKDLKSETKEPVKVVTSF